MEYRCEEDGARENISLTPTYFCELLPKSCIWNSLICGLEWLCGFEWLYPTCLVNSIIMFVFKVSSIVVEVIRTILFFCQDILHKNKTRKYLNTPRKHNKAHKLGDICSAKIADKKNNQ